MNAEALPYLSYVLMGSWLTIGLALASLVVAVILGMLTAAAKLSSVTVLQVIANTYSTLIRGVPPLVWMLLLFFGGQILINRITEAFGWEQININAFLAGVITLGFIFGAYMSETFRGAIMAVNPGEIEAGHAYGMNSFQVFIRITFPAMLRHAISGFGNNWLVLLKETALVSLLGLHDMVFRAQQAGRSIKQPFTFFLIVAILFLLMTAVSTYLLKRLEAKANVGVKPR